MFTIYNSYTTIGFSYMGLIAFLALTIFDVGFLNCFWINISFCDFCLFLLAKIRKTITIGVIIVVIY